MARKPRRVIYPTPETYDLDEPHNAPGTPSPYRHTYPTIARNFCFLKVGATDDDIADLFGVTLRTIYNWKVQFPLFRDAIVEGGVQADGKVASALYRRALGDKYEEEAAIKLKRVEYEDGKRAREFDEIKKVTLKKELPPDTPAAIHWLSVRTGGKWRSKVELSVSDARDTLNELINADALPPKYLQRIIDGDDRVRILADFHKEHLRINAPRRLEAEEITDETPDVEEAEATPENPPESASPSP